MTGSVASAERTRSGRRAVRLAAALAAAVLVVAGCGSGGGGSAATDTTTLDIGYSAPPNTLDPAKAFGAFQWYVNLAYDPLIYLGADGELEPRLAESWRYVGEGNRLFELTLRPGVTFSDGSPLTAQVVARNIEYYRSAGGESAASLGSVAGVETPDDRTVRISLSTADPSLPVVFTQVYLAGNMISGPALDQPDGLARQTAGAGPYQLDAARTVPGDHYTYVPNPHYWNSAAVHYDTVTIKVLPNPNTALAALRTGQVDVVQGDRSTVDAAASAGLTVSHAPQVFVGLALADRAGTVVPALGDVRVRQALNYAVDRERITRALYGQYGQPTEQVVLPGRDGFNDTTVYTHDPERAAQLLAEAGYPGGFTLPVLTTSAAGLNMVAQAIGDDLGKIGVRLEYSNEADPSNYGRKMASGEFGAFAIGFGTMPVALLGPRLFLPTASQFNPLKATDPELTARYQQAAAADATAGADLDKEVIARLVEQAWFVPVSFTPLYYYAGPGVAGVEATAGRPTANPTEWHPA